MLPSLHPCMVSGTIHRADLIIRSIDLLIDLFYLSLDSQLADTLLNANITTCKDVMLRWHSNVGKFEETQQIKCI